MNRARASIAIFATGLIGLMAMWGMYPQHEPRILHDVSISLVVMLIIYTMPRALIAMYLRIKAEKERSIPRRVNISVAIVQFALAALLLIYVMSAIKKLY